ncbi:MAG: M1 family metallopeptidase [Thermoflavifilum sp.]|nr:M1 family metallopeptidase [Thermoflavifilum sp.]
MSRFIIICVLALSTGWNSFSTKAQAQDTLPTPRNIVQAYEKGTRQRNGLPGPNYWQNRARYDIDVYFTPETRLIAGKESIIYVNNSPDTLHYLWFKLYPNFYQRGAIRSSAVLPQDLTDGVQISAYRFNGVEQDPGRLTIQGTNMIMPAGKPLFPHDSVHIELNFSYELNKTSHQRTGEIEEGAYFVAYFFPRIAVYDDIDGWNTFPYNGLQEFYNDFCDFDVRIHVPDGYVVWATGNLMNAQEVLQPHIVQRLHAAETQDDIRFIIDSLDLQRHQVTQHHPMNVWHYVADDVTDFVFATSNRYVWQSTSLVVDPSTGRRTRVDAVYDPRHTDYAEVIYFARKTVEGISYFFPRWPYPYPHETVVDGLDQMEYPMMVNDNPLTNRASTIELTDHEIFHTLFPFYMGTNETKYAWMDEGWATIGEWILTPYIDSTIHDPYGMSAYDKLAGTEIDLPIMTLSTQEEGADYYLNSYPKPAMGYLYIRDMLGDSLFLKALHHYMQAWHGKHPMPYDFFYCMNAGAGKNLNWFWEKWFFDTGFPDLAIDQVTHHGNRFKVVIQMIGNKPVPVDLRVFMQNGDSLHVHRDISCWEKGNRQVELSFRVASPVVRMELGGLYDADVNPNNNVWKP